jgi:hypothetical protein
LRDVGAGRPLVLSLEDRLLSTLLYYRLLLTGFLLSCLFELDASNLWLERNWRMVPLLQEVLPTPMQDHFLSVLEDPLEEELQGRTSQTCARDLQTKGDKGDKTPKISKPRKRIGTLKELFEAYPELRDVCVDATEQQVPTPKNKRQNRQFYSGKSHCHTIKTQLTTAGRLVLHLFGGTPGNVADRQVLKASGVIRAIASAASPHKRKVQQGKRPALVEPRPRRVRLDRGYSGLDKLYPDLPGVQLLCALKGTSRSTVTALGKDWNQVMVARGRIQIEQNIGHLKNWRVLSGLYRARVESHPQTMAVVAGLHNFRILGQLHWAK